MTDTETDDPDELRRCPVCNRIDATMKASSVARSQRGRFMLDDGGYAAYETELGSLLSRPQRPELLPMGTVIVAFVIGWLLLAFDLAIVAALRAQDQVAIPDSALSMAMYLGILWFGLLIPGVAIARYFVQRDAVKRDLPEWREAVQRWQNFHYCSRDDVVFVPGEGAGISPEHISVLYRKPEPQPVVALRPAEAEVEA
jgi:hypothetical protein